ncbi:hypothetical protein THAR02_02813 [Trichoderma harzianum]|uniref:Uncharacterized protein n=1 Tax=Trichoderma harzianum TaxID=5544 RepID=A0A0F9ZYQ5_TRIHA|nr:hypothetical protein THAR02_02813 [Trichoderma harzianum]
MQGQQEGLAGQVMPVWITLSHDEADIEVSTKGLSLTGTSEQEFYVESEEDIGESIARHICDAGVLAICAIAESSSVREPRLGARARGSLARKHKVTAGALSYSATAFTTWTCFPPARDAFRVARVQHGRDRRAAAVYKSLSGDKAAASLGGSAVWPLIRSGVDGVTQADVATARS